VEEEEEETGRSTEESSVDCLNRLLAFCPPPAAAPLRTRSWRAPPLSTLGTARRARRQRRSKNRRDQRGAVWVRGGGRRRRNRESKRRERQASLLSCSLLLSQSREAIDQQIHHRCPASCASVRQAPLRRPPEGAQGEALCIPDQGRRREASIGALASKREARLFLPAARRPPPPPPHRDRAALAAAAPLFSLEHYVRLLAAALPALGHAFVLSDRHGEIKAEKKEVVRRRKEGESCGRK